jgi:hypothetical protein
LSEISKLDYSISLREKGLSSNEIKEKMKEKGFEESQIQYYLKKSDEIFLNQTLHRKRSKSNKKTKNGLKMIALLLSILLLLSVFLVMQESVY